MYQFTMNPGMRSVTERYFTALHAATNGGMATLYQEESRLTYDSDSLGQLIKAEEIQVAKRTSLPPVISLTDSDVVPQPPPPLTGDLDALAKAFVDHYYPTFDNNRGGLASLYQDDSMLTFDGHKYHGVHNIMARLTTFPFDRCRHQITTYDWQPCPPTGGLFVFVTGKLQIPGQTQVHQFTEMFHLVPLPRGGCYVLNDIFRLNSGER